MPKIKYSVEYKNKFIEGYLKSDEFKRASDIFGLYAKDPIPMFQYKRLETRTRKENSKTALSFAVHDPLWMLTRQWQFGEFKGDDCGSAIWAKVKIEHAELSSISNGTQSIEINKDNALEHHVERMNIHITEAVRIESAYRFKKSIDFSSIKNKSQQIVKYLQTKYPLASFTDVDSNTSEKTTKEIISEIKKQKNTHLEAFLAAFGSRSFDGYHVYLSIKANTILDTTLKNIVSTGDQSEFNALCKSYATWFKATYQPVDDESNFWVDEKLGYELSVSSKALQKKYAVEDYHSGRLSWYSFDVEEETTTHTKEEFTMEKYLTFIPTLAEFPGSPNKRLWTFEDAKIAMGNSELSADSLANAVILQYTTMYGNDWLVTPMELNAGMISQVKGIMVTDVFGVRYFIDSSTGQTSPETSYSGKWEMFTTSKKGAYEKQDFKTDGRLFFPPTVARTEESMAVEEVQFLRDEMANMVWAVETKINDNCGNTLDGDNYAAEVNEALNALNIKSEGLEETEADYSYLFQNNVPLNWIPFSPVKFSPGEANAIREIRFQRSTMPLFIKDSFEPIRPSTRLMRTGINDKDEVKAYKFINEEEILAIGTKVALTNQRTRWFKGKTFNWLGDKKEISRTQANSGLSFDELVEIVSKSASDLDFRK